MEEREGFPDGSAVKNLSAVQERQVWSLGLEDPLEEEMAPHSSIPDCKIPWGAWRATVCGAQSVGHDWETKQIHIKAWF